MGRDKVIPLFIKRHSEVITTKAQLKRLQKKMWALEEFAFDTETNTLKVHGPNKDFKCVGISISWGMYDNYYIPVGHLFDYDQLPLQWVVKYLKPVFSREHVTIIGHNLKFDMHVLARIGIFIKTQNLFDTMIASWICDENSPNGLKENTQEHLGVPQTHFADALASVTAEEKKRYGLKANSKPTFDFTRYANSADYALDDAFYTFQLYQIFMQKLVDESMDKIYYKTYPPFIYTLFNMEERGITVDIPKLKKMGEQIQNDLDTLDYEMTEIAGVRMNFGSSQQLAQLLFGYNNLKNCNQEILDASFGFKATKFTAKGVPQASGSVLEALTKKSYTPLRKREGVEFCLKLLDYKKLSKLKTAFVDGLLEQLYADGKCHPSFNIIGTDSGRISCSSPNLQQLPNPEEDEHSILHNYPIRDCFIGSIDKNTGKRKHIISVDWITIVHYKPCELLEVPKAS